MHDFRGPRLSYALLAGCCKPGGFKPAEASFDQILKGVGGSEQRGGRGSSFRCAKSSAYGTSIAKSAPVAGALKIAATPAAAPSAPCTRARQPAAAAATMSCQWRAVSLATGPYMVAPFGGRISRVFKKEK